MRKLIRLLAGVVLVSAFLALHAPGAYAHHGVGHDPTATQSSDLTPTKPYDDPLPPPTEGVHGDSTGGWHEEEPDLAIAQAAEPCVVTGTVDPGVSFNNDAHLANVPLVNDNPSHSHFEFINTIINCKDAGALQVEANGGNDGHMIDILDPLHPVGGANGDVLELDLDEPNSIGITGPDTKGEHDFNAHHGSVNESAWSHSAGYSMNGANPGGESNACTPDDSTKNQNKADISIVSTNGSGDGWVKYIRVGVVVYAWGCVDIGDGKDVFSAVLVILPNVLPTPVPGFFDGTVFNPICPLESVIGPPASPCGFILVGVAWRGPDWRPPPP